MDKTVVIIGLGQLGRVFAGGFLRAGYTVVPVNRNDDMDVVAASHPDPDLVLVAVAEPDLHHVLSVLPPHWKEHSGLLQNELLPRDWEQHGIINPTVIPVWFEKKKGSDAKPLLPSPIHGPQTETVMAALRAVELPCTRIANQDELLYELVRKNLYILTTNIAGLRTGGNVGDLWHQHRDFVLVVQDEVMDIQDWLTGRKNDRGRLIKGLVEAIEADPAHLCTGRSAISRLARALRHADDGNLAVPILREVGKSARA